jgi:hypothetical protein
MRRLLLTLAFALAVLIASTGVAAARPCPETGLPRASVVTHAKGSTFRHVSLRVRVVDRYVRPA